MNLFCFNVCIAKKKKAGQDEYGGCPALYPVEPAQQRRSDISVPMALTAGYNTFLGVHQETARHYVICRRPDVTSFL